MPVETGLVGAGGDAGGGGGASGEVTGSGGEELATEVTVDRTADAVEALAATIDGNALRVTSSQPQFITAPPVGTEAPTVYLAGAGPFVQDRFGDDRYGIVEMNSAEIATNTGLISGQLPEELAASGGLKTELVAPLPAGANAIGTVEVTASALPTDAAKETKQDVGNASLTSIDGKTPALGQAAMAGSVPVVVASDQTAIPISDGGGSITVDGSLSVSNFPASQDVVVTSSALPSGAATSALQGAGLPAALTAGGGVKVGLVDALPAGANAIGSVSVTSLPGSPAQEHVTAASPHAARLTNGAAFYVAAQAGDNLGADLRVAGAAVANGNPVPVSDAGGSLTVDDGGGSITVDGAVTATISGTPSVTVAGVATNAAQTDGTQRSRLTDGTNNAAVTNAAPSTEYGVVVRNIPSGTQAVTEANSTSIATNTGRIPPQGQALAGASTPVVLPLAQAAGPLALQAQLPTALVNGRLSVDGSGVTQPVSAASLPLPTGAATAANQVTAQASFTNIDGKLPALGPALYTAAQPVVSARPTRNADGSTLAVASTSHVIIASAASLRRLEWRYTGGGTKYIVICNQAGGTATAANWTKWYRATTNGAGLSWFEWPEGLFCNLGIVLGVSATEPTTTLTLSANVAENFIPVNWSYQ